MAHNTSADELLQKLTKQKLVRDFDVLKRLAVGVCRGEIMSREAVKAFLQPYSPEPLKYAFLKRIENHCSPYWKQQETAPFGDGGSEATPATTANTVLASLQQAQPQSQSQPQPQPQPQSQPQSQAQFQPQRALPRPPRIPESMETMTQVMRDKWYRNLAIPVSTSALPVAVGSGSSSFDRNDLYRTNQAQMRTLMMHNPNNNHDGQNLMIVCVTAHDVATGCVKKYVTWCTREEFSMFASDVGTGTVRCNERVQDLVSARCARFEVTSLSDEMGYIDTLEDLDDFLYMLETYIDGEGARYPVGLNCSHVYHLTHRALYLMGGNVTALKLYESWQADTRRLNRAAADLVGRIDEMHTLHHNAHAHQPGGAHYDTRPDPELEEAMKKTVQQRFVGLKRAMEIADQMMDKLKCTSKVLYDLTVEATASFMLNTVDVKPEFLIDLRKHLARPVNDVLERPRAMLRELEGAYHVRAALFILGMTHRHLTWGEPLPPFTVAGVKAARHLLVTQNINPDKHDGASGSNQPVQDRLEQLNKAHDILVYHIEHRKSM